MIYHLEIEAERKGEPIDTVGPRNADHLPAIGSTITETFNGKQVKLKVVSHHPGVEIEGASQQQQEVRVVCQRVPVLK